MSAAQPIAPMPAASLLIAYDTAPAHSLLARPGVLAVIGFAPHAAVDDARHLRVPLHGADAAPLPSEIWQVEGAVRHGRDGDLRWAEGGDYLFLALDLDESVLGGPEAAAEHAYRRLAEAMRGHGYPHLLRAWNYLAAINEGEGDAERYRRFSLGRLRGMGDWPSSRFPAATAIGHLDPQPRLLVYALAARRIGHPVENPRQVSAYRYPRQYGPVPPSFARAMRVDTRPPMLLVSGTASVVGHASAHEGDAAAQAAETLRNLDALVRAAGLGERLGACAGIRLKAYLRHPGYLPVLRATLAAAGIAPEAVLFLHGEICRRELLLEIDGIAAAA